MRSSTVSRPRGTYMTRPSQPCWRSANGRRDHWGHASQVDLPVAVHGSVANLRDFMGYREARRAQQTGLDFSVFPPLAEGGMKR